MKPSFGSDTPFFTVVGVVKDVKQGGVDQKTGTELYFHDGNALKYFNFAFTNMNLVVRCVAPDRNAGAVD